MKKTASGHWDVFLSCEVEVKPQPCQEEAFGIDVGLAHFATLSNGKKMENPRFFSEGKKALAKAGRKLGWVNPAYTTQDCSQCGFREAKLLSAREHSCAQCGYKASRDLNAAQNILALGLDGLGTIHRSLHL